MKKIHLMIAAAVFATGSAFAAPLSGNASSGILPVPGATETITFEDQGDAYFASRTIGSVTFTGLGGQLDTSGVYSGSYNTKGTRYLENAQGSTPGLRFDFANTVSAFAFTWGASDTNWTLSAFDSSGNLLDSMTAPYVGGSNNGEYVGLSSAGISYATLTHGGGDWILIDNFTIATENGSDVPEPASLALFGAAMAGIAGARRRKSKTAV